MLLLPAGAELNPFAVANPPLAVGAKCAFTALLLSPILGIYANRVRAFGAIAWTFGAFTNALVIL